MRIRVTWREVLVASALVASLHSCWPRANAQIAKPAESPFDRPVRTATVDLGLSEFYRPIDKIHSRLTCWYYPHFLIKELDFRQKGAEWDAIVPIGAGHAPKCEQAKQTGEIRQSDYGGYFSGVVGNLVFLDAADGLNGGLAFRIIDATSGKTVFEDEAKRRYRVKNNTLVWEGERLRIEKVTNGVPALTYLRVYHADCVLPKDGAACWSKIRAATGVKQATAPACTGLFKEDPDDPSVIFYPVRVELGPKFVPVPAAGQARCEAQE